MPSRRGGRRRGIGGGDKSGDMNMTDVAIGARKVERAEAQRGSKEKEPRDYVQDLNLILLALDCIALVLCVLSIENGWTGNSWDPNVLTELSKWGITIVSIASAVRR